ncbi:DEAD/DEAH box helicase [Arthrospira platensis]|uniref:SNF2 helicase homolog n=1 Tax=Limnospira platensis NIES-46 TaxID=1236695 RepID=A0A5M3SYN1_LIMPL|nr:DEAD/DEAH box helicase [Arthrospira platensis]MBD2671383.1 DEAD/DEAH box helicase [Arthrospira platensis FACHB-439]MBD2712333.1 DEAD/DEAH box helicase [Arthrospira platensis FACHB-835]MDF2212245.1 DEAD/DEAH box helicase [Arthrospira platensis NCB002]MDT9184890.1 DEAD/DEAH box helicase [Limnospira sp. PMC 289.06]MDT9297158.1 DEAD/DEAH box helicase [Arthrospira platensis PCC 7345]QQW27694.1 DEAD/DEAH box helicase [Arthrospira sp. PCC 9108]BAI92195.1 SNF2 helicase homolog [Arthrospira platen
MAILHGTWRIHQDDSYVFIWGETWRGGGAQQDNRWEIAPLSWAMTEAELSQWSLLQDMALSKLSPDTITEAIALPTHIDLHCGHLTPIHSAATVPTEAAEAQDIYLYPWLITGYRLNPSDAFHLFESLPLGTIDLDWLGDDIRFWSHVNRWSLDLLARRKFLPIISTSRLGEGLSSPVGASKWQPIVDSATDRARLLKFAGFMPTVCRISGLAPLQPQKVSSMVCAIFLPGRAEDLILGALGAMIDCQVRHIAQEVERKALTNVAILTPVVRMWLHGLADDAGGHIEADRAEIDTLQTSLENWMFPLQQSLVEQTQFRASFRLQPPQGKTQEWLLEYGLQAIDDPDFVVDAATIWKHPVEAFIYRERTIRYPQETLLAGLGLACKLYPVIENSLAEASPQGCWIDSGQVYEFITRLAWRFSDSGLGVILPPGLSQREGWASRLGLRIKANTPRGKNQVKIGLKSLLNFKWELSLGGQSLSKAEFERLVAKKSPLVEVNGEWVELRERDIKAAQAFFASRKEEMTLSLEDALRLSTGDSQTIERLPVVDFEAGGKLADLLTALTDNRTIDAIATPPTFKGELRPYQARGAGWLNFLQEWGLGACLADDMGLGKTIELMAFLLHLQLEKTLINPVLLVCPTSVLGNWEREVKRFGPSLKTLVHHGDKRAKGKAFPPAIKGKNLVITSYALTYRDQSELQSVKWQGVVLDEAQNIKNPEAKQSKTVKTLEADFKIALTGTPVENRLSELWSILEFLNPGYLGQRPFFQRRFAIPIEKYGDTESLQILRSLVQPFILRRLKTDKDIIQDLPEKQENTVFCPLSKEQASLYQKLVDESLSEIESSTGIQRRGMILGLLVKLKQVCNHPLLLGAKTKAKKEMPTLNSAYSGKLQRLNEMLEELISEGDRALIFTQFAEWGKLLKPYLEAKLNREVLFLYGGSRKLQREQMVDRFQQDPQGPPVMILSLKAGGVGLNLTRANHVFHFDRWWNPAVENQATDRVFRIGQTRNVQVHKFVCTGTLEEKIHDLIESKQALAEQVVSSGEDWLTEMDTDQLRNLLILDRSSIIEESEET